VAVGVVDEPVCPPAAGAEAPAAGAWAIAAVTSAADEAVPADAGGSVVTAEVRLEALSPAADEALPELDTRGAVAVGVTTGAVGIAGSDGADGAVLDAWVGWFSAPTSPLTEVPAALPDA